MAEGTKRAAETMGRPIGQRSRPLQEMNGLPPESQSHFFTSQCTNLLEIPLEPLGLAVLKTSYGQRADL
jgi:hypothetical protein